MKIDVSDIESRREGSLRDALRDTQGRLDTTGGEQAPQRHIGYPALAAEAEAMIAKCLEYLGCEREYFLTRRVMPLPTYRAMIFLILREKGGSEPMIGRYFHRDHSTVHTMSERVRQALEVSDVYAWDAKFLLR